MLRNPSDKKDSAQDCSYIKVCKFLFPFLMTLPLSFSLTHTHNFNYSCPPLLAYRHFESDRDV